MFQSTSLSQDENGNSDTALPRKYIYKIDPMILEDWEFYEEIARISKNASEQVNISPLWKMAYEMLALACNYLVLMITRRGEFPKVEP